MHYYQFNIGDYHSHTAHLEPMEDLAYRRMMDWCYLNESPLPEDIEDIARLIRMRSHTECIAVALRDFFTLDSEGYRQNRIDREIAAYNEKSDKARKSAQARWSKKPNKNKDKQKQKTYDANGMRPHSERNANQEPLTINHKPINGAKTRFSPPSVSDVFMYCQERRNTVDPEHFVNFYESKNWMIGKNKMKDWRAAVRTWEKRDKSKNAGLRNRSLADDLGDTSWAASKQEAIEDRSWADEKSTTN